MVRPTLRSWNASDAPALLHAALTTPDLDRQLGGTPKTLEDATELISRWATRETARAFVVDLNGQACGNISISHIEPQHGTGWVSYWLASDARGKGFAASGLAAVAGWAFERIGLYRLELGHRTDNRASCRVAIAAGFAAEGIERQKLRYGNERYDVETHARLRTDPPASVTPLEIAEDTKSVDASTDQSPSRP